MLGQITPKRHLLTSRDSLTRERSLQVVGCFEYNERKDRRTESCRARGFIVIVMTVDAVVLVLIAYAPFFLTYLPARLLSPGYNFF